MERKKHLRDNKLILNLYQVYKYIVFFPFLGVSLCVLSCIALPTMYLTKSERIGRKFGKAWARACGFITPMFVSLSGTENIVPNQSYILVANHRSLYDVFAVYGWLPMDFRYIMKKELSTVPVMGYIADKIGHIGIDRSNTQKAIESINNAKAKISDGSSILFFAEGRRSDSDVMLPFKKGAFRLALDMQLPILPMTILGTEKIVPSQSITLFPGRAKIILHKPIETTSFNYNNMQQLMDETRRAIESGCEK